SQHAVPKAGRSGIENLKQPKPKECQERNLEGNAKSLDPLGALGPVKRNIEDDRQRVFGEIDGHIIAEKLTDKILEQNPANEQIETPAPIIQNGDDHRSADKQNRHVSKVHEIIRQDKSRD